MHAGGIDWERKRGGRGGADLLSVTLREEKNQYLLGTAKGRKKKKEPAFGAPQLGARGGREKMNNVDRKGGKKRETVHQAKGKKKKRTVSAV